MRLSWIAWMGLACAPELPELDTSQLEPEFIPPQITLIEPADGATVLTPATVRFQVEVFDQPIGTVPLTLRSSLAGALWQGNVGSERVSTWRGDLPVGAQVLTVEGVDRHGDIFAASAAVTVRVNTVPTCRILAPDDGSRVRRGVDVRFEAIATDEDGDALVVLWRSSLDGAMAIGESFSWRMRAIGEHRISVEALDPLQAGCRDEITLFVDG